jgi:uncharacterized damage-inducible protein DinB
MDIQDIEFLYAYDRWANAKLLAAAGDLSVEQLHRNLGSSHSSVFGTLLHIMWGEWRWIGRWGAPTPGPGPDPSTCESLAALRARWSEIERAQAAFVAQLSGRALAAPLSYENPPGKTWTYPLGQALQHLANHSTYHRGQVTTMLRQLGAAPMATDLLVFVDEQGDAWKARRGAGVDGH